MPHAAGFWYLTPVGCGKTKLARGGRKDDFNGERQKVGFGGKLGLPEATLGGEDVINLDTRSINFLREQWRLRQIVCLFSVDVGE